MIAGYATLERQIVSLSRDFHAMRQTEAAITAPRRSAVELAADLGLALDPWQRRALTTARPDILLLVTRQGGKGMVASLLALDGLLNDPGSTTVIVSKADRQAKRLLRRIKKHLAALPNVPPPVVDSQYTLELRTGSEILALPGDETTIRGVEAVDLLIVDEAAVVPESLYYAVRPMLAVSKGRCIALTTPRGKRGWFYEEWTTGDPGWHREQITAHEIPRIDKDWLARERALIGDWWFRQEYLCEFVDTVDQVFSSADVEAALDDDVTPLFEGAIA